jgi:hypothetical protein
MMVVVLHGAVALVSAVLVPFIMIREGSPYRGLGKIFSVVFLGYLVLTALLNAIVYSLQVTVEYVLEFVLAPAVRVGGELYGAGSPGVIFIWWGLPVSLALFSVLIQHRRRASSWKYAGLVLLAMSFGFNMIAPSFPIDRYGGLTAWLILALSGGEALVILTGTSRRLLLAMPIIFLVCFSAVVDPSLSPQYGYQAYRGLSAMTSSGALPTTQGDRVALDWVSNHVFSEIRTDVYSESYLVFSRYRSGTFSIGRIRSFTWVHLVDLTPWPNAAFFFRWSNAGVHGTTCAGLISALASEQANPVVNILYDSSCDVVEANPAWV